VELRRRGVTHIYSSDLQRAAETASIIGKELSLNPVLSEAFREIRMGPWEGRLVDEVEANDGEALWKWRWDGRHPPYPDVEAVGPFLERMMKRLEGLVEECARVSSGARIARDERIAGDLKVAIVTHGGSISVLMTHLVGLDLTRIWQMPVENGSISRVLWEGAGDKTRGKIQALSWNETGHLSPKSDTGFNSLG
jgi:broad specificity phosphatase PhoE